MVLTNIRHATKQDVKYLAIAASLSTLSLLALPLTVVVCTEIGCAITRRIIR